MSAGGLFNDCDFQFVNTIDDNKMKQIATDNVSNLRAKSHSRVEIRVKIRDDISSNAVNLNAVKILTSNMFSIRCHARISLINVSFVAIKTLLDR
jgi:ethanolamine ammonia-lyase small subunit